MRRHLALALVLVWAAPVAAQTSWIFQPSHFSHDPQTGQRTAQYAPPPTPFYRDDPTYRQSAYRHNRISIRVGDSSDNLHLVETWGAGEFIRPYGEWLRPFREGATPFGPWGNPQGPWTTPFDSWVNPYGLGRPPYPPYPGYSAPPASAPPSVPQPYAAPSAPQPYAAPSAPPRTHTREP